MVQMRKITTDSLFYAMFILPMIIVAYMLFPESAYAWGPGVHIKAGLEIVKSIYDVAPLIAEIISNHPYYYLYGCISPDIIVGKKFATEIDHCHNWEVGRTILAKSESDAQRSLSYGYLSHLAGDVVAHNYFVPNQIISNFIARTLRHTYWEMRYDGLMEDDIWEVFTQIPKQVRKECNKRLKHILTTTLFSFSTNKRIFNSMMHINRISGWQEMIRAVSMRSQWVLTKKDVKNYYKLTLQNVADCLREGDGALCMNADPNGKAALKAGRKIRKDLRVIHKQGKLSDYDCQRIINELRPHFIKKLSSRAKEQHTIRVTPKVT